jgi:hypothetical protein
MHSTRYADVEGVKWSQARLAKEEGQFITNCEGGLSLACYATASNCSWFTVWLCLLCVG